MAPPMNGIPAAKHSHKASRGATRERCVQTVHGIAAERKRHIHTAVRDSVGETGQQKLRPAPPGRRHGRASKDHGRLVNRYGANQRRKEDISEQGQVEAVSVRAQ